MLEMHRKIVLIFMFEIHRNVVFIFTYDMAGIFVLWYDDKNYDISAYFYAQNAPELFLCLKSTEIMYLFLRMILTGIL